MRKFLGVPAVLAACMLAVTPAQAQFGGLLRKVTTPAPKPSSNDNGGCPKGKKGSSIGRNILGNVLNDAVGDAASKAGVYSYVPIGEVSGTLTDAIACRLDPAEQVQAITTLCTSSHSAMVRTGKSGGVVMPRPAPARVCSNGPGRRRHCR